MGVEQRFVDWLPVSDPNAGPRRLRNIQVTPEALAAMFREEGGWLRTQEGIPDTARVLGSAYDPYARVWNIMVEDKSFPEVPFGEAVPPKLVVLSQIAPEPLIEDMRQVIRLIHDGQPDAAVSLQARILRSAFGVADECAHVEKEDSNVPNQDR